MRWTNIFASFSFIVWFHILLGHAHVMSQHLLLKNYTTQDGLPDSRVAPIIQDSKGYLWFGTQAGLTRYDGREFQTFGGAKDIPGVFGRDIVEDHSGAIWFAYSGFNRGGLLRYHRGSITEFDEAVKHIGGQALAVVEDTDHTIWVGSSTGLIRVRFTDSSRTSWKVELIPEKTATALFVDSRGNLWIGTGNGALLRFNSGGFVQVSDTLPFHFRPYSMYETREGELWAGGVLGAVVVKGDTMYRFGPEHGLPSRGVWCFAEDNAGNFWAGTVEGLYRIERSGRRIRFVKAHSFGDAVVYDMCLDAEGNLWFASDPGLRKLLAVNLVVSFEGQELLSTAGFGPIAQQPDRSLLFGSRNVGVVSLNRGQVHFRSPPAPSTYTILSIFSPTSQRTLYGMKAQGLILQEGKRLRYLSAHEDSVSNSVHRIGTLSSGGIILGTDQGLQRLTDDDMLVPLSHPILDSLIIFDFARHRSYPDEYWLATSRGLRAVHIDGERVRDVKDARAPGGKETIVYTLLADGAGRLWCGTDGSGLIMFDGAMFTQYTTEDGLVGDRIYALAEDSIGGIWIGTSAGLSWFDGGSFRNFTHDQGFREIGLHGLLTDRDGFLWVSSFPGISKIRPPRLTKSTRPPPIYISGMQVDEALYRDGIIKLEPDHAVITFRFAGLSFTDESNVRYKYMLEGFDRDWSRGVTHREVRYTHLSPGEYTFKVLARSADGIWSTTPATFSFSILPPVWMRWWFVAAAAILLIASVYGLYRYRLGKALQLERTRSRIAMDLHDDIGSSLTRISVLSEVARHQADTDSADGRETLKKIGDTARELIDALGDIVWSVDPRQDDLQNVIRRIAQFGQEICEGQGIAFETEIHETFEQTRLSLEQRRDVFLVFKEALNNSVKHSRAQHVRFTVTASNSTAVLMVADDGIGYSEENGRGLGLKSMKQRAERVAGRFLVHSENGGGTRVSLAIKTI